MKVLSAVLIAGLTCVSLAGPARAFTFAPKSAGFTATGSVVIAKPTGQINCGMTAKGFTTAIGTAKITAASFTPGVAACANTAAQGLPWPAKAVGAGKGKIAHVSLIGAFTGACGPAVVPITVSGAGVWAFSNASLPGGCKISGSLHTTPHITVVP